MTDSTIRVKEETKVRLDPYRKLYGSYDKAINEILDIIEGNGK